MNKRKRNRRKRRKEKKWKRKKKGQKSNQMKRQKGKGRRRKIGKKWKRKKKDQKSNQLKKRKRKWRKRRKGRKWKRKRKGKKTNQMKRQRRLRRRRRKRRKMRQKSRKLKSGRKLKNLNLMEILRRLNRAEYRSAAVGGTSTGLADRLIRHLGRAGRVARSWRSLRRRWPLVRTVKVFVVLLRRSELIVDAIGRHRTAAGRRPALLRRLRLARLHLDRISAELRLTAAVIRARAGARVVNMLQLAVRTQRNAVRRLIHSTSRPHTMPTKQPHGTTHVGLCM